MADHALLTGTRRTLRLIAKEDRWRMRTPAEKHLFEELERLDRARAAVLAQLSQAAIRDLLIVSPPPIEPQWSSTGPRKAQPMTEAARQALETADLLRDQADAGELPPLLYVAAEGDWVILGAEPAHLRDWARWLAVINAAPHSITSRGSYAEARGTYGPHAARVNLVGHGVPALNLRRLRGHLGHAPIAGIAHYSTPNRKDPS